MSQKKVKTIYISDEFYKNVLNEKFLNFIDKYNEYSIKKYNGEKFTLTPCIYNKLCLFYDDFKNILIYKEEFKNNKKN